MTDYLISGVYKLENTPLEIPPGKCGPFTSGGEKYLFRKVGGGDMVFEPTYRLLLNILT